LREKNRQDMEMKNGMLTIAETAYLLNVHINTVRRWSDQGMLKSYRIGTRGDRRFRREDIDSFLAGLNRPPDRRQETVNEGRKKILIADDDSNIRALVKRMLGSDYLVLDAGDGDEAVSLARRHSPDLVLMDILMPNTDGYTACRAIKQDPLTRGIPVVMLSGIAYELNKKLSQQMGADGYITKPFDSKSLLDGISDILNTRGLVLK
jgi:excisionase family DNA binding protein